MERTAKKQILRAPDGAAVLIYESVLPSDTSEYMRNFYESIEEGFEKSVNDSFHLIAIKAYSDCTDRRKRYRYTPMQAKFICRPSGENEFELQAVFDNKYYINERHKWRGDVIKSRKRVKQ